jgi:hypothetical protein
MDSMADSDELTTLRAENGRLIALLESHGIEWRAQQQPSPQPVEPSRLSTDEKVAIFRRLFRGRTDVFPVRWESKTTGKSGYAPGDRGSPQWPWAGTLRTAWPDVQKAACGAGGRP